MARQPNPKREEAFEIYKVHNGDITNRAIAEMLDVPEKTIGSWKSKSKDDWVGRLHGTSNASQSGVLPKNKRSTPKQKEQPKELDAPVDESEAATLDEYELNMKQRHFVEQYLKTHNATSAYKKAYKCAYTTAMTNGSLALRNTKIAAAIAAIKKERLGSIQVDEQDVLEMYKRIAFADITDFVTFGNEEVVIEDEEGQPLLDDNGNPKMYIRSYVHINDADEVDGTVLTEVRQGKEGVGVKLASKMEALRVLLKYSSGLRPSEVEQVRHEQMKADALRKQIEAEVAQRELEKAKMNDQAASVNNPLTGIETDDLKRYLNAFEGG